MIVSVGGACFARRWACAFLVISFIISGVTGSSDWKEGKGSWGQKSIARDFI